MYFKAKASDAWQEISFINTCNNKGYYKIDSVAHKLSNGLYSEKHTIVTFQKKIKYTWTITLSPDVLCYRTSATINFIADTTLKCQYQIDGEGWKWYREPVKIYKNCTIQARSLDGDDDYESNITSKVVDIIDTATPTAPVIAGVTEGAVGTIFIPTAS
jgi:hypothetical protein